MSIMLLHEVSPFLRKACKEKENCLARPLRNPLRQVTKLGNPYDKQVALSDYNSSDVGRAWRKYEEFSG
jgi:hypothetical protein